METNICKFIGYETNNSNGLKILNYVYETEVNKIYSNYIIRSAYYLYLVVEGSGTLNTIYNKHQIKKGDMFITFPSTSFKFEDIDNLRFAYISFIGIDATKIVSRLQINKANPVMSIKDLQIDLESIWMNSINLSYGENIDLVANGILLYSLGLISKVSNNTKEDTIKEKLAIRMKNIIDENFSDTSLNLAKISKNLNYNPNYLSFVFKDTLKASFTSYLTDVRINAAIKLMENGFSSIKEISFLCGFSDSLYFSKVFKKFVGYSPLQYISKNKKEN